MAADDIWAMVTWERDALADQLADLEAADWDHPTRCGDWRVRDVVGHLSHLPGPLGAMVGLARCRFDVDAFIDGLARERGERSPDELLADLRAHRDNRQLAPGVAPSGALVEILVHGDDIRQALDLADPANRPAEHLTAALDFAVRSRPPFRGRSRVRGLALDVDQLDWHHGSGTDVVHGGPLDVLSAVLGRREGSERLSGAGADVLRSRAGLDAA